MNKEVYEFLQNVIFLAPRIARRLNQTELVELKS